MSQRIAYYKIIPSAVRVMRDMENYIKTMDIAPRLRELIKIRVSQINGCAFCLDMHTTEARALGETEKRLNCIAVWQDCDFFTDAEKAALNLAEHVTLIASKRVPDEVYQEARRFYDEKQYVDLIVLINQINSWNRLSISMATTVA